MGPYINRIHHDSRICAAVRFTLESNQTKDSRWAVTLDGWLKITQMGESAVQKKRSVDCREGSRCKLHVARVGDTFTRHVHQARTHDEEDELEKEGGLGRAGRVGGASGRDDAVKCVGQAFDLVHNIAVMSLETELAAERPDTANTRVIS